MPSPEYNLEEDAQIKKMQQFLKDNLQLPQVQAFVQSYDALRDLLENQFPEDTSQTDEEWCDYPADAAMQRFRFWWTWGN
jgi:hypothetical protein